MDEKKNERPADVAQQDSVGGMLRRLADPKHLSELVGRSAQTVRDEGFEQLWRDLDFRIGLALHKDKWQHRADRPTHKQLRWQRAHPIQGPTFSIVVPLYNTPMPFYRQMTESVRGQTYQNWQLVLVDASDEAHAEVGRAARADARRDGRILYCKTPNRGISQNTNVGFAAATGDWIALLDHDDLLYPNALYEVAAAIGETGAELVYSDEIILSGDLKELGGYHFKPDFAPDYLRGCNYITHLAAFSRELAQRAGFEERSEFDGAQDHDLLLRLTEHTKNIHHIPKVLYIWRGHANSTAASLLESKPYAVQAGAKAVEAHLARLGLPGSCTPLPQVPGAFRVRYELTDRPFVSVLIPSKDHVQDLRRCLDSLYQNAGYTNFETIIIENNSTQPETWAFYETIQQTYRHCRVVQYKGPFNFSAINNFGADFAQGQQLLLLNNDIEVTSPDFLRELLSYSQRPDVGCVGAKLFYPDGTIQHGGVIMGINGSAGHSHKGHPHDAVGDLYRLVTTQNYMAVTGACLMVKKSLYDSVGGLDETLFAVAYNDIDLCLKLWQRGLLNVYTPFAQATHYESKSRGLDVDGENARRYEREKANFYARYRDYIDHCEPYYNPHFNNKFENFGLR